MKPRVLSGFVIRGVALSLALASSLALGGCCTAELKARTLQRRSQLQNEARFVRMAHRLAKQRGGTPVRLQRTRAWRSVPFGVPTRARTPTGQERILIAAHLGRHPGMLVARRGPGRYLVFVATPRTTRSRSIKSCGCQSHGGAHRQAPRPPVYVLPVNDLSEVTVIPVHYHRRTLSVRRNRCPGPPVP